MTDAIRDALVAARELAKLANELTGCRGDDEYVWGIEAKIDAALAALAAETSVTPADVGELVERLREHAAVFGDNEGVMRQWDSWRKMIANGHKGSLPRDAFESLIDGLDKDTADAATALERVVRERDEALILAGRLNGGEELQTLMRLNNDLLARATNVETLLRNWLAAEDAWDCNAGDDERIELAKQAARRFLEETK